MFQRVDHPYVTNSPAVGEAEMCAVGGEYGRSWSGERSFWKKVLFVLAIVSLLRGVRLPSSWAATQALVNYDNGLVKRGLFGATFGKGLHLENYLNFTIASYLLLFLLLAILVGLTYRAGVFERLGSGEVGALFFGSFVLTYLANLIGYFDIVMAILTSSVVVAREPQTRRLLCLPICVLGILVHESFLVLFVPVIALSVFLAGIRERSTAGLRWTWLTVGLIFCVSLAIAAGLSYSRPMSERQTSALQDRLASVANFPIRRDFFSVLNRSAADNLRFMWHLFHIRIVRLELLTAAIIFLPVLLLLAMVIKQLTATFDSHFISNKWILALSMCAALAPLTMPILGWDFGRWDALACLDSYFVVLLTLQAVPKKHITLSPRITYGTVLALALSMASDGALLDDLQPNPYPFLTSVNLHSLLHLRNLQPPK